MCDPVTAIAAAGLAISAAGAGANYLQGQQQAKAQDKALLDNANAQNAAMAERYKQQNAQAADEMSARARAALIERGRLQAASGESGLGDNTGRTLFESYYNESTDISHIMGNNAANLKQSQLDATGMWA